MLLVVVGQIQLQTKDKFKLNFINDMKKIDVYIKPEVVYLDHPKYGSLFTMKLKAYVRFGSIVRRINRGYFVKFLEMIAGLTPDQAAELLNEEYMNRNITWES